MLSRTEVAAVIGAFIYGFIVSRMGGSLYLFVISVIVFEILVILWTRTCRHLPVPLNKLANEWKFEFRIVMNLVGFAGWVLGRWWWTGDCGLSELNCVYDVLPGY